MPFYIILKLFLLFFLCSGSAFAQNYPVNNFNATNALPNNAVRSLFIDSQNILWIGTENGVIKKENDEFKYFFEEDGLALNSCWAIAEDKNSNLWFGSYGEGVSIYDGFGFRIISEEDGLVHNEITKLFSSGKYMYVGTSDGVSIIDVNTFEVLSLDFPTGNELLRVQDFFEYKDQVYVITYGSGIFKIYNKNDQPSLTKINDHKFIYSVLVENDSIYSSNKGFFTKTALSDYVKKDDSLSSKKLGTSIVWDYVRTRNDKIFAAAWGIYDPNGGIYEVSGNQLVSKASEFNISSKEVISLAYDPVFEKLYVGTKDAGVFEIALNPQIKFQEIEGRKVLGFAGTNNSSAVLFNDGILLKRTADEQMISLVRLKKWQENYVLNTKLPLPKHSDHFYELDYSTKAEDILFYDIKVSRNVFWVNTNIGIFAIEDSGELKRYLPLHTEEINFTPAGNLIETNPYGGVRVYRDLDEFEYTRFEPKDASTPTMVVNSLQKENRTYFLSVFSGLYVWENEGFKSYLEEGIWKEKKLKHITALENDIAISNEFGDVFIVNDEAAFQVLKKIPRARIHGNSISFLKDYQGTLIIGTEKGLTLYKEDRFIFLNQEQGLEQPLLSARINQNLLSVGTSNGYYVIDLDAFRDTENLVDQINLQEVFINNKKFPLKEFNLRNQLNLTHNENTVLLKFSTNAHPYPNKLKYQYRLNPKEEWSLPFAEPEIFLPSLPPEDYELDVKVLDESTGLTYTRPLLNMAILPPFWKTWWFALLAVGVMITGVYTIYSFQISQTKKFEEQKGLIQKRFEETKMEALLAQMNPHFIFNAMNSIQYYIMDSDIEKASGFLGDFSKLIRLNLDHCTKPTIFLIEEIEYLQSYIRVENTRFNNAIQVKIETDPAIDPYELQIPTMILQTFVENVFVHAFSPDIKNPKLRVSFNLISKDVLQCAVEDNGVGFSDALKNKLHSSKGVSLVKERLELLGYEVDEGVKIISAKNKGTSVILKLKV